MLVASIDDEPVLTAEAGLVRDSARSSEEAKGPNSFRVPQPAMEMARKKTSSFGSILVRNMSGDMTAGYSIMIILIYP